MKRIVYSQLNPRKTMKQLVTDRNLYRMLIMVELLLVWCS